MTVITTESANDVPEDAPSADSAQKKLPNMNEFSPGTLDTASVREVLKLLEPHQNDWRDLEGMLTALQTQPKILKTTNLTQRKARARNVLIGMSQCGLLEKEGGRIVPVLTEAAKAMVALSDKEASDAFSKYLLLEAHGLELLDVVAMIRARGGIS